MKKVGKKYADEQELSASPERRSTMLANIRRKKYFEESKSNIEAAASELAKKLPSSKNLDNDVRHMDILSQSTMNN